MNDYDDLDYVYKAQKYAEGQHDILRQKAVFGHMLHEDQLLNGFLPRLDAQAEAMDKIVGKTYAADDALKHQYGASLPKINMLLVAVLTSLRISTDLAQVDLWKLFDMVGQAADYSEIINSHEQKCTHAIELLQQIIDFNRNKIEAVK